ncbi:hypothetical protein B0T19DRAFT_432350 [Cercophora scortea]|uniref:Uncharacterized protein n=1 Tax=Cercophora scortea TaxID=314031 RepID=A0AAE0IAH0_9PEZI|nr:hypothetical protein B0T19DRAFT_432350 [Cercophora scortea]
MHTDGLVMLGAGEQAPPAAPASAPAPSWTPDPINKTPISGPLQLLGEHKAAAGGGTRRSISSDEAQQQQSQPQEQHDSMEQVSKSASGGRGAAPPEGQQGPDPDLVVSGLKKLDLSSKAKTKNKNNKKKKTADKTNGDKALGNVQLADSSGMSLSSTLAPFPPIPLLPQAPQPLPPNSSSRIFTSLPGDLVPASRPLPCLFLSLSQLLAVCLSRRIGCVEVSVS